MTELETEAVSCLVEECPRRASNRNHKTYFRHFWVPNPVRIACAGLDVGIPGWAYPTAAQWHWNQVRS